MRNVFIIADDTTGANSSAILNKKLGYNCVSIHTEVSTIADNSVYSFSTNSRGISPDKAYQVVLNTLRSIKYENAIYNKRVDSTLRGNLGSELNAFFDHFPNKKAVVVASFPSSGRTCVNNTLFVNGTKLEHTDVAKDPKCPVTTSVVTDLFKLQTNHSITNINLDIVRSTAFKENLMNAYTNNKIIVIDAETNDDIDFIAKSCVDMDLDIITVDPGPFTHYYTKNVKLRDEFKFYGLVGSVTPLTLGQMKYAKEHGAFVYELDVVKILSDDSEIYLNGVYNEILEIENDFLVITTSCLSGDSKLNLVDFCKEDEIVEDVSNKINKKIANLFTKIVETKKPHCVYTSGGDTTVEFLNEVKSYGLKMNSEILPLTVASEILGGRFEGLNIVSKGGLIGSEDTLVYIYNYMKEGGVHE